MDESCQCNKGKAWAVILTELAILKAANQEAAQAGSWPEQRNGVLQREATSTAAIDMIPTTRTTTCQETFDLVTARIPPIQPKQLET